MTAKNLAEEGISIRVCGSVSWCNVVVHDTVPAREGRKALLPRNHLTAKDDSVI